MAKIKRFEISRPMLATIFTLAWPTMLEQLLQTAVQYVDTAMVGSLGTDATAAVGSTSTVNWLVGSTISALGVGFLAFISQSDGAQDTEKVRRASSQSCLAVLFCGILFTLLTLSLSPFIPVWMKVDEGIRELTAKYFFILYTPMLARSATIIFGTVLRAVGDTKTPMIVGIAVNAVNVVLNFFLIFPSRYVEILSLRIFIPGAGMEVIGAALASAAAFWVGGILISIALFRHKKLSPRLSHLKPDREILLPCLKVAFPNALQRFGTSLGYVVFAAMVNLLGDVSTAAHTIANTVESAFYIPGYGMQTAAATLAGNAFGEKNSGKLKRLARTIIPVECILMMLSGALLFVLAPAMMGIFSNDAEVISLGSTVLRMVALSEPFYGISIIIEGMMHGMGKTVMPFTANIVGMWGIRIVGTFICTQLLTLGLVSAWACMILHNIMLFGVFLVCYLTGKWNPLKDIGDKKCIME